MDHSIHLNRTAWIVCILLLAKGWVFSQQATNPEKENVREAMRLASAYMANTVSYRGGYLWKYSEDFSEVEGEAPSRLGFS